MILRITNDINGGSKHLLTLDFGLDVIDGVRGLNLEGDSLTREGLDENLHDGL